MKVEGVRLVAAADAADFFGILLIVGIALGISLAIALAGFLGGLVPLAKGGFGTAWRNRHVHLVTFLAIGAGWGTMILATWLDSLLSSWFGQVALIVWGLLGAFACGLTCSSWLRWRAGRSRSTGDATL